MRASAAAMIDFPLERWAKIREDAARWWAGELDRPLIQMRVHGQDPGRPEPKRTAGVRDVYDLSIPAEDIVDCWDYGMCRTEYLGDAFPSVWPNFGPGVLATFLGGRAGPAEDTVWFRPADEREIADLHLEYNPDSVWLRRLEDICRAATDRWQGQVLVGMTDLGGTLDVLSTFRPAEQLLLDLVDHPDEVRRVTWEIHEAWWRAYEDITRALGPANPGHGSWAPIYSRPTYYMLQCDFAYMIGPRMFDEFVRPELAECCRKLGNAFYHLDGIGQLPHVDSLLAIEDLKGIQWVPGEGKTSPDRWVGVHRRIRDAGRLIQIYDGGELAYLDTLAEGLGSAAGIVEVVSVSVEERAKAEAHLRRYGAV